MLTPFGNLLKCFQILKYFGCQFYNEEVDNQSMSIRTYLYTLPAFTNSLKPKASVQFQIHPCTLSLWVCYNFPKLTLACSESCFSLPKPNQFQHTEQVHRTLLHHQLFNLKQPVVQLFQQSVRNCGRILCSPSGTRSHVHNFSAARLQDPTPLEPNGERFHTDSTSLSKVGISKVVEAFSMKDDLQETQIRL